ncbi:MAG: hypothetical protein NTW87_00720 [Planctomycetota bacterium]|nr:hypothetical protein [Planctomycetota bacterium]
MPSKFRLQDRRCVETEIREERYSELLRSLQDHQVLFRQFSSWDDLLKFMRKGSSQDPRKNELLRAMLDAYKADNDRRWPVLLLVVFWPGLESLCLCRQLWESDLDELWQATVIVFLESLRRVDTTKRPTRLVQKIINDTAHHLHDEYRRRWRRTDGEVLTDWDTLQGLAANRLHYEPERLHVMDAHDAAVWRLRVHVDEGRISEADFNLVVGTRIYGHSISDYARSSGESYEALKKRRQRAEACIRDHELSE